MLPTPQTIMHGTDIKISGDRPRASLDWP